MVFDECEVMPALSGSIMNNNRMQSVRIFFRIQLVE
jgi:hypothetical protein